VDLGAPACDDPDHPDDGSRCRVNGGCGRFVEIWNLVFIQFNHLPGGGLEDLPARHVDTGMGFERLVALDSVLDKMKAGRPFLFTNYDTDLFRPIFDGLAEMTGIRFDPRMERDELTAYRVIADHVRALCIAMADGVMPDRKGRGSVLRSLVRRASRFGRQVLGLEAPFLHELAPRVSAIYEDVFPEVGQRLAHIRLVLEAEEVSFGRTIDRGIARFASLAEAVHEGGGRTLDGVEAYRLYHQDGFPRDLIDQMARERGLVVDEEGWRRGEEEHRRASEGRGDQPLFDHAELEGLPATRFVGYPEAGEAEREGTLATARLLALLGTEVAVLDRTPFYPEAGGQVGDRGSIEADSFLFRVDDTGRVGAVIVHFGELERGDLSRLPGQVTARVDARRRADVAANHTATHLLHWALRKVLGDHATQQGSLVRPDYLRFDFTHPSAMTRGEIEDVERRVNERIARDVAVRTGEEDLERARERGVTALFGEKYAERVRVVGVGGISEELCGGTHVPATGRIGYFRIESETAVSVGVRRILAVTRARAVERSIEDRRLLDDAARLLSVGPPELLERIQGLRVQVKELKRMKADAERRDLGEQRRRMIESFESIGGVKVLVDVLDGADRKQLGSLADALRSGKEPVAGVLVGVKSDVVAVLAFASRSLVDGGRVDCGAVVRGMAEVAGARGGGRKDFAQTGWKGTEKVDPALARARELIAEQLDGR
jgi:alanyl-tRNA synthetase